MLKTIQLILSYYALLSTSSLNPLLQAYVKVIAGTSKVQLPESFNSRRHRVLAVCCYMADRPNLIEGLVDSVEEARCTDIDFAVSNNSTGIPSESMKPYVRYAMPKTPKYVAVARIVKDQFKPDYYDYLMIIDDDVKLPINFFDEYLCIVHELGLALSQPALTEDSLWNFRCTRRIRNAIAHLTLFVESGPVTCFDRRLVPSISFKAGSPMGWGVDLVWARVCADRGWLMGVIDRTPVQHKLRKIAKSYRAKIEQQSMLRQLSRNHHMPFYATHIIGQILPEKDYNLRSIRCGQLGLARVSI